MSMTVVKMATCKHLYANLALYNYVCISGLLKSVYVKMTMTCEMSQSQSTIIQTIQGSVVKQIDTIP